MRPDLVRSAFCLALAGGLGCASTPDMPEDADTARRDGPVAAPDSGPEPVDAPVGPLDGGPPPESTVPMFVAVGWGGRRITSCDRGRTWIADQYVATEDDWHQTYTPKSLAYGDGTFVFLSGWGNDSTAWVSTNGIDWTEHRLGTPFGGVGRDGDRFILIGNRTIGASSDDGSTWDEDLADVPASTHDRDAAAFTGIWAAGADGTAEVLRPGGTWTEIASCTGIRHGSIGVSGGFEAGLGRLVSFGDDGDTCVVDIATGADLGAGSIGVPVEGRGAFVGDAFWVVTGGRIYASSDGLSWSSRALPSGVDFDRVARSSDGTYVGVSGNGADFYYSDDGEAWTRAEAPAGNGIVRVIAGLGSPSAQCPVSP